MSTKNDTANYFMDKYGMRDKDAKAVAKHYFLDDTLNEIEDLGIEQLEQSIAACLVEIEKTTHETHNNENYKDAKETTKMFNDALGETVDPYKSRITLMLSILQFKKRNQ